MDTLFPDRIAGYLKLFKMTHHSITQLNQCSICKALRLEYELSVQQHLQHRRKLGLLDPEGLVEKARAARADAKRAVTEHQKEHKSPKSARPMNAMSGWSGLT